MPELAAHLERVASELAPKFHEAYERLAPQFGYETRKDSAVPWEQVPERNRKLMTAVCKEVVAAALAACAREAKLEEALWWEHLVGDCHGTELASECIYCERILKLRQDIELSGRAERAVGEKGKA